ncbi:High mobility group B protein 14 [Ranunculus cassubicifolius]
MKRRSSTRLSRASEKENNSPISLKKKYRPRRKVGGIEDPNKPKKPPTAFFYFLEDFRSEYQAQNPNVKQMRDVGKACGEKWKTMKYEEKVKYFDIATEKRAEFDKAIAQYERNKGIGGEDQDDDFDDSDF